MDIERLTAGLAPQGSQEIITVSLETHLDLHRHIQL